MNTLGNSKFSNLRKQCLISVAAVTFVATLLGSTQPANAMSFGHGVGGGFHQIGGFHAVGSFHSMGSFRAPGGFGGLNRATGLNRSVLGMRHGPSTFGGLHSRTTAIRQSRHVEPAMSHVHTANQASEGVKIAAKSTPKSAPKADNKIVPGHAGISVDNGNGGWKPYQPGPKDPPSVARGNLDGGRDAGAGMKMRPGTEKEPSWAKSYDPDNGQTIKVVDNGDGTRTITALVSYAVTPDGAIIRIDDLPRIKKKVQADCRLLAAKVAELAKQLAQQQAILAALQGAQNVTVSSTITGVSTSFASPDDQAAAVARMQARIATTQQLLGMYQADLNRCLAGGN